MDLIEARYEDSYISATDDANLSSEALSRAMTASGK